MSSLSIFELCTASFLSLSHSLTLSQFVSVCPSSFFLHLSHYDLKWSCYDLTHVGSNLYFPWPQLAGITTDFLMALEGVTVAAERLGWGEEERGRGEGCPVQLDAPQGRELHQLRSPEIAKQTYAPSALAILLDMRPSPSIN